MPPQCRDGTCLVVSEFWLRASHQDGPVLRRLLGATPMSGARDVAGIAIAAPSAASRPHLAQTAAQAGVPVVIDPLTPLWQAEQHSGDSWSNLPYARARAVRSDEVAGREHLLARSVIEFQLRHGASRIVPPYVMTRPDDGGWPDVGRSLVIATGQVMTQLGIQLPLLAFAVVAIPAHTEATADPMLTAVLDGLAQVDQPATVALCGTWPGRELGEDRLRNLHLSLQTIGQRGLPALIWRHGVAGPLLSAAGAIGYSVGAGWYESCYWVSELRARRNPPKPDTPRGGPRGIYLELFQTSVPPEIAQVLLGHRRFAGSLVCSGSNGCCGNGATEMIANPALHAVLARTAQLRAQDRIAQPTWRLSALSITHATAADRAEQMNNALARTGHNYRLPLQTYRSAAHLVENLRQRAVA